MFNRTKIYPVTSHEQLERAIDINKGKLTGACVFAALGIADDGSESGGTATGTFRKVQGADGVPVTHFRIDEEPFAAERQVVVPQSDEFFAEAALIVRSRKQI